jgi:hypothetical protein
MCLGTAMKIRQSCRFVTCRAYDPASAAVPSSALHLAESKLQETPFENHKMSNVSGAGRHVAFGGLGADAAG